MKKKGNINRYGWGVTIFSNNDIHWYWVDDLKQWMKSEDIPKGKSHSTHYNPCRTLRAFERHLRKHCKDIKNAEIIWVQRHGSNASINV